MTQLLNLKMRFQIICRTLHIVRFRPLGCNTEPATRMRLLLAVVASLSLDPARMCPHLAAPNNAWVVILSHFQ